MCVCHLSRYTVFLLRSHDFESNSGLKNDSQTKELREMIELFSALDNSLVKLIGKLNKQSRESINQNVTDIESLLAIVRTKCLKIRKTICTKPNYSVNQKKIVSTSWF